MRRAKHGSALASTHTHLDATGKMGHSVTRGEQPTTAQQDRHLFFLRLFFHYCVLLRMRYGTLRQAEVFVHTLSHSMRPVV
jgi:hypothetical protein